MRPRNITPEITAEYLESLTFKDFMGLLTPDEIPIARENGLLVWDLYCKAKRLNREHNNALHEMITDIKNQRIAPSFRPDGQPVYSYEYIICNYEDLERYRRQLKTKNG